MNLLNISWPVFRLGEHKPQTLDGVVFYSKEYVSLDDDAQTKVGLRIVDDTTLPGTTLGQRRLQLAQLEGVRLFKIKLALYFLHDLIKIAKQSTWFIDSQGQVFQYRKSTRAKLSFHKIEKILPIEGMGCVVQVKGIPQRFKCLFKPTPNQDWAGVLKWGLGYLIYGFYEHEHKTTHRLV